MWVTRVDKMIGQSVNTPIRYRLTFDKTYSSKLLQRSKLLDACISQPRTAGEIDISDPVANFDQLYDCSVCDVDAMPKMDVVKVFTQLGDCENSSICDFSALR